MTVYHDGQVLLPVHPDHVQDRLVHPGDAHDVVVAAKKANSGMKTFPLNLAEEMPNGKEVALSLCFYCLHVRSGYSSRVKPSHFLDRVLCLVSIRNILYTLFLLQVKLPSCLAAS